MRVIVVDDERLARNELKRLLKAHPRIQVVGEASNGEDALALIGKTRPDLVFLDIQMPAMNGFEMLSRLDDCPSVVFTTAYDEHAIRAFDVNALDYLMKPIEPERLATAISRAAPRMSHSAGSGKLGLDHQVFVRDGPNCWFVRLREVCLFESEGNYTRLHFGGREPLALRSLAYLEERLDPACFFRANRRQIVSLGWVESVRPNARGSLDMLLRGGRRVVMSRRQARRFQEEKKL